MLSPDLVLDRETWGRYVVLKPLHGKLGQDVRLLRIEDVAARYPELTLDGRRLMVIQPYIEHSEDGYPTEYRVLSMFGRVLYCARNRWGAPRRPLEEIASDPNGIIASNDKTFGRVRTVCNDPEIIPLGEQTHSAFPECPTVAVDIIRDADTGRLCFMEVNPEGLSWHFSSVTSRTFTADHIRDLYSQFNALDRTAELLIEKTRAEAT
jgi:glutathione synthase/RimK-type ligase-like ATP-grasp enzyme